MAEKKELEEKRDYNFESLDIGVALDINEVVKHDIYNIVADAIEKSNDPDLHKGKNVIAIAMYEIHKHDLSRLELILAGHYLRRAFDKYVEQLEKLGL